MIDPPGETPRSRFVLIFAYAARIGLSLALVSAITAVVAGIGSRFELWHFRTGFSLLQWGTLGGGAAGFLSLIALIGLWRRGGSRGEIVLALLGFGIGVTLFAVPVKWMLTARNVPPIHDITTDTENPPEFVAILKIRQGAPNPAEYGGPEIAAQQKEGYPNLGPLLLPVPPDQAFERALEAARSMGWQIVDANREEGRIEGTDTTFWFGFKDDVIVRITSAEGGSRIDVRSLSRVGRSDVGTNARRIENYLKKLQKS
jgi:uncharacterized protein (DUF1499 family)